MYSIRGIDVSKWQGKMNWKKAHKAGIHFAFIKAGGAGYYGNYEDIQFKRNADECAKHSIPVGYYWYFDPTIDAIDQADYFWELVKSKPRNLPLVLDLETSKGLSAKKVTNQAVSFSLRLKEHSKRYPILYSRASFLNVSTVKSPHWSKMELWVARYTVRRKPWGNSGDSSSLKPAHWDQWVFWQYSADGNGRGAEFGAESKSIDLDYFIGNAESFSQYTGVVVEPIEVAPEPVGVGILPIQTVEVTATALNLRALPDANSDDLGELVKASKVSVTKTDGVWMKIEGWIHGGYTKPA